MARHTFTVTSSMTPDAAFAALVALENVPEWDSGILSSTKVDRPGNEAGPLGDRYDLVVTGFDGQPDSAVYEITEVDRPHGFVMVGTNDTFRAVDELVIRDVPNGCEVTYRAELTLLGEHPPLNERQLASMFPKIAAVAERGLTAYLNPRQSVSDTS